MRSAELKVVVFNDLKGLGATQGPPVKYQWSPPSALPRMLPWLVMLGLLLLKFNRSPQAWLIWLPLGVTFMGGQQLLEFILSGTGGNQLISIFGPVLNSLSFALAATWLLAPILKHRFRIVTGLLMLLAAGVISSISFVLAQDWSQGFEIFASLLLMGLCVLFTIVALNLSAWRCQRRYRPAGLLLWSAVFMTLLPFLIFTPFMLAAVGRSGAVLPWREFFTTLLGPIAACFALLLMYLMLAMASGFYRRRLQELLQLAPNGVPPVLSSVNAVPPPVALERGSS